MKIGDTDINKAYIGSDEVDKIYLGTELVYEQEAPATSMWDIDTTNNIVDLLEIPNQVAGQSVLQTVSTNLTINRSGDVIDYEEWDWSQGPPEPTDACNVNLDGNTLEVSDGKVRSSIIFPQINSYGASLEDNYQKSGANQTDTLGYFITDSNGRIIDWTQNYDSTKEFQEIMPNNAFTYDSANDTIIIAAGTYDTMPRNSSVTLSSPIVLERNSSYAYPMYTDGNDTSIYFFKPTNVSSLSYTGALSPDSLVKDVQITTSYLVTEPSRYVYSNYHNEAKTLPNGGTTSLLTLWPGGTTYTSRASNTGSSFNWSTNESFFTTKTIFKDDLSSLYAGNNATYEINTGVLTTSTTTETATVVAYYKDGTSETLAYTAPKATIPASKFLNLDYVIITYTPSNYTRSRSSLAIGGSWYITYTGEYSKSLTVQPSYSGGLSIAAGKDSTASYFANFDSSNQLISITSTPIYTLR